MRILLATSSYLPVLGGVQVVTGHLADYLRKSGRDNVRVVTQRRPRSLPVSETLNEVRVDRVLFGSPEWGQIGRGRPDLWVAGLWMYPVARLRLNFLLGRFRPEVVNLHFPSIQIPFWLRLRKRFRFRLVVSLHGDEVGQCFRQGGELQSSRLRKVLEEADAVTTCSKALLRQAEVVFPGVATKGVVIHNGIDPERFNCHDCYENSRPYLLAYGRLTRKKGFDLLIRAFAQSRLGNTHDLLIAGSGEETERLQMLAAEQGVADSVRLLGRASPEEVVRLLNGCAAGVVPSREEPFGIVAVEMLASGKPVVATRVGGLVEIFSYFLDSDFPVLSVAPDIELLSASLVQAIKIGDDKEKAKRQRALVRNHFAWGNALDAYRSVLDGRKR